MCHCAKFSMSDHMLNIRLNIQVQIQRQTQDEYTGSPYKVQTKRKGPTSLVKFHGKRIRTSCLPRGLLRTPLRSSTRSCGTGSEMSHYCLSTAQRSVWRAEHVALTCRRELCRLTSGAEPSHRSRLQLPRAASKGVHNY